MKNLAKIRFDMNKPLVLNSSYTYYWWRRVDAVDILAFLACFPSYLPVGDGVEIDVRVEQDPVAGVTAEVVPRPEIEQALIRFSNLKDVCLNVSKA